MILAAGLSPAWQHVIVVERLRPGEVNRAREVHACASGKVINAGLALHRASGGAAGSTLTLATVGGAPAQWIAADLARLGAPHRLVRTAAATRECTTVLDLASGTATELVENARPISAVELEEFCAAFGEEASRAGAAVLTGSTPPGVPANVFAALVSAAACPVVLDVRGPQLLAALASRPFLVKPNREELAETLGVAIDTDEALRDAMAELVRRGAQSVAVTAGREATWVLHQGKFEQLTPPTVEQVVNPIGCGDCLAGGAAWAVGQGATPVEAVWRGMLLAAENLQTLLPGRF